MPGRSAPADLPRLRAAARSLLLVFAAGLATSGAALELPGPRETWLRLQVGETTVLSSTRPSATVELAENLQYLRAALGKVTRLRVSSSQPLTILVFADEKQYATYVEAALGRGGKRSAGVFQRHPDGDEIAVDYAGLSAGVQILYHEATHRFVHDTTPGAPLWLSEGLAELYSTFARSGEKISIGHARVDHLRTLAERPLLPLPALLAVRHESPDYNEPDRARVFYAESWALVHYLMVGGRERQGQLAGFLGALAAGRDTEAAFRGAFAADYATLEAELRAYVQKKLFPYLTLRVGELAVAPLPTPETVPRDAVLVALGTFLARATPPQLGDAEQLLREALKLNPANPEAWAMVGVVKEEVGATEEATAAFEKALQVGPGSFVANFFYARRILRSRPESFIVQHEGPPADVKRARELFARSVEVRPDDPRAYAGLGRTYLFQRSDLDPGVAALEKSLAMAPAQPEAAFDLVQLYLATDQVAKATSIVEGVLARAGDPALADEARRLLRRRSAPPPAASDPGVMASPESIAAPQGLPALDPEAERVLQEARARQAEQEEELARFRAFAALVNAGKYEEALAAADEFLRTAKVDVLIRQVTDLRVQLAERLAQGAK